MNLTLVRPLCLTTTMGECCSRVRGPIDGERPTHVSRLQDPATAAGPAVNIITSQKKSRGWRGTRPVAARGHPGLSLLQEGATEDSSNNKPDARATS